MTPQQRRNRENNLRRLYGIGVADYDAIFAAQDGRCAICRRAPEQITQRMGRGGQLVVHFEIDHCHRTNKVRGILCYACNRALGMLGDDIPGLMRAIEYLRKAGE